MAGEAVDTPETPDEGEAIPTQQARRRRSFSPWLRMGAALRKGSADPRPVKLARLGVSGQGSEGEVTPIPPISDPGLKELDLAPIRPGLSYIRITYHNTRNEYLYEVIEPPLSNRSSRS